MTTPCRGRIVWVEILDPHGRNPKARPAIILTPTDEITPDGYVAVVAISTQFNQSPVDVQVELPWHPDRQRCKTQLTERCVAICTWLAEVPLASIQNYGGVVPGKQMLEIHRKIESSLPPPTP